MSVFIEQNVWPHPLHYSADALPSLKKKNQPGLNTSRKWELKINPRICSIFCHTINFLWYDTFYFYVKLPRLKNLDLPWWIGKEVSSPTVTRLVSILPFLRVFPCIVNLFIMYRILIIFILFFFPILPPTTSFFITFCAVISPLIFKILFFS